MEEAGQNIEELPQNAELDALPAAIFEAPVAPLNLNPPGTQFDHVKVIKNLLPFLRTHDMKYFRRLSCNWNYLILTLPKFQMQLKGNIRGVWYRQASGLTFEMTPRWNAMHLHRFQFYRHSTHFRSYWTSSAELLQTLTLQRVSLECDGFIFLLSSCPLLKTLTLDICHLRDIDDHHGANRKPQRGVLCLPPIPTIQHLEHLNLKSIDRIEQCFMDYLIERTGNLETFQIVSCFVPTPTNEADKKNGVIPPPTKALTDRYNEFEGNLIRLLEKNCVENRNNLIHFTFSHNYHHTSFFNKMASRPEMFNIPKLTLEANTPDPNLTNYQEMIRFSQKCNGVEELNLNFQTNITSISLKNLLEPHLATLKKLYIGVRGDRIVIPLILDFLKDFLLLDDLEIEDTKPIVFKKIKPIIGGNRIILPNDRVDTPVCVTELITNVWSRINHSFMKVLPPELKKLALNHYITSDDPLHPIGREPNVSTWRSLRKLSKLEIRGPWILTISGIIGAISIELPQLETLALTACGLEDKHLTGLDEEVVGDMFNCIPAGIEAFRGIPDPGNNLEETKEVVKQAILTHMRAGINIPRSRLSELQNLKSLDLSLNPGISDASLFDALQCPGLKALNLSSCSRISDDGMDFLTIFYPGLEVLNVKHCRKVTKRGLNKLVDRCRNLKKVYSTSKPAFLRDTRTEDGMEIQLNPMYKDIVVTTVEKHVKFPN